MYSVGVEQVTAPSCCRAPVRVGSSTQVPDVAVLAAAPTDRASPTLARICVIGINRQRERENDGDDRDHDHQFDQGVALVWALPASCSGFDCSRRTLQAGSCFIVISPLGYLVPVRSAYGHSLPLVRSYSFPGRSVCAAYCPFLRIKKPPGLTPGVLYGFDFKQVMLTLCVTTGRRNVSEILPACWCNSKTLRPDWSV